MCPSDGICNSNSWDSLCLCECLCVHVLLLALCNLSVLSCKHVCFIAHACEFSSLPAMQLKHTEDAAESNQTSVCQETAGREQTSAAVSATSSEARNII